MKKIAILFLLMITLASFIGCGNSKSEVAARPIHNIQKISGKRATDKIVYTDKIKKQYHRSSCRHKQYTTAIKMSDAKNMGLMPCRVCNP